MSRVAAEHAVEASPHTYREYHDPDLFDTDSDVLSHDLLDRRTVTLLAVPPCRTCYPEAWDQ